MVKKHNLYINFPDDLESSNGKLFGLITNFIANFKKILERFPTQNYNLSIKGKDFSDLDVVKLDFKHSVTIFFYHPDFVLNDLYQQQLETICEQYKLADGDISNRVQKVYKIYLEPLAQPLKPECLDKLISYDLFEKNLFSKKIKSLQFDQNSSNVKIFGKLLDLAYDINNAIVQLSQNSPVFDEAGKIFLGWTSLEQQDVREEIQRELQHFGYKVLPQVNMPANFQEFEDVVIRNLENSDTIIQLMGPHYGEIFKGTKFSMSDFQNKIISEYLDKYPNRPLRRYIWVPAGQKINDQKQQLYLKRLKRDDADWQTEIIETPLEVFKTIIGNRLTFNKSKSFTDLGNIFKVYLLTEDEPAKEVETIYSALTASGLKVITLDYSEQSGIYTRHLQCLRECDSVIIFQQGSNKYWLMSKLRDLIKSPGIGREKPYKKVLIVSKVQPEADLVSMIKGPVEVINNSKFDEDYILQKLITE